MGKHPQIREALVSKFWGTSNKSDHGKDSKILSSSMSCFKSWSKENNNCYRLRSHTSLLAKSQGNNIS